MHHDVQGVGAEERHRHIEVAVVDVRHVPRILDLEIGVAFLVFGDTYQVHTVVVGSSPAVIVLLTVFLADLLFRNDTFEAVSAFAFLVLRHRFPFVAVGAGQIGDFSIRHDSHAVFPREARVAHIATPYQGVAVFYRIFHNALEFVQRHIVNHAVVPVVGHVHFVLRIERVVGVGSEFDIVVGIQAQFIGIAARRVFLAIVGKGFRIFAQVALQNAHVSIFPSRGRPVAPYDPFQETAQNGIQFAVVMGIDPVVQAGEDIFGHHPVHFQHIGHVIAGTASGQFGTAMHAHVLVAFQYIAFVNRVHVRQIHGIAFDTQHFGFQERNTRKAPAGT